MMLWPDGGQLHVTDREAVELKGLPHFVRDCRRSAGRRERRTLRFATRYGKVDVVRLLRVVAAPLAPPLL